MKRIFSLLIPHHIGSQVGLIFGLLLVVSLGFLGFSLINTSRQAVVSSVLRDYEDIARRAAQEIGNSIDKPQGLMVNTAVVLGNLPPADRETRKAIIYQFFTDQNPVFEVITLTDTAGREFISSDWNKPLGNCSASAIFQMVRRTNRPAISPVYFSAEHFPYLNLAVPVRRLDTLTGYLIAEVKLSSLWEIIREIKLADGEAFLVDEAGYILVHKEERRVYRGENLAQYPPVQAVLAGHTGSQESADYTESPKGQWLTAYAPVVPFGWGLVIRQSLATAYAFSTRMENTALIIIILAIITAIFVSFGLARWLVRPIRTLVYATEQVAAGNLDQNIETPRRDEVGRLLNSFNQMLRRLREARRLERLSSVGLATSKIGHELRNPLVALKTFIQLLPRKAQDEKFILNFNQLVPAEMNRLENMVQELTEFSATPRLRLAPCVPAELVRHTVELFRAQLESQNITVHTDLAFDHVRLTADGDRLKQVLINLVNNALSAMPEGGRLEITGRVDEPAGTLRLAVTDTGFGILPEELPTLFEPFRTAKRGGLGLGLTICKEIIEQHRGQIQVSSRLGAGTTFTITLPLNKEN